MKIPMAFGKSVLSVVVALCIAFGLAVPALAQADLETTPIVATNSILTKRNSVVNGDVVLNRAADPGGPPPVFLSGDSFAVEVAGTVTGDLYSDSIHLKKFCTVGGTLFVNTLDDDCSASPPTGAYSPPIFQPLPFFRAGSPGGDDVIVNGGETVTLTQSENRGGIIDVKKGGKLIFSGGGTFDYEMLDTRSNAIIEFTEPTVLLISGLFDVDPGATFLPTGAGMDASDIVCVRRRHGLGGANQS